MAHFVPDMESALRDEQLDREAREEVRNQNLDFIQNAAVRSVAANVVYATAIKAA